MYAVSVTRMPGEFQWDEKFWVTSCESEGIDHVFNSKLLN